jgi:hypothetical protein
MQLTVRNMVDFAFNVDPKDVPTTRLVRNGRWVSNPVPRE